MFKVRPAVGLRNVLLGLIVLYLVFACRYTIADRYAFFIPFYCLAAVFVGLGAYRLQVRSNSRAFVYVVLLFSFLPVGVYAVAPQLAQRRQLGLGTRGDIPYRNDYEYFLRPWKTGYTGAQRFAEEGLETAQDSAVIWADATTVAPLLYVQEVEGRRPDVKIVGIVRSKEAPRFDEQAAGQLLKDRPVYVTSRKPGYCPPFVLNNYNLVQTGVLWRVVER
jgi:hypothetical protein